MAIERVSIYYDMPSGCVKLTVRIVEHIVNIVDSHASILSCLACNPRFPVLSVTARFVTSFAGQQHAY